MQADEKTFTYSNPRSEEELLLKNMGLVHSIAARFPYSGVEYEDLVQIGSLGLLKAIRNFDESKGFAFSTYAVPVITGEIKRFLRDDGAIKVSRAVRSNFVRIRACTEKLRNLLAETLRLSELVEKTGLTLEEVVEALDSAARPASLDETLSDDGDHTLADTVAGGRFFRRSRKDSIAAGNRQTLCGGQKTYYTSLFLFKNAAANCGDARDESGAGLPQRKKILEKLKEYSLKYSCISEKKPTPRRRGVCDRPCAFKRQSACAFCGRIGFAVLRLTEASVSALYHTIFYLSILFVTSRLTNFVFRY